LIALLEKKEAQLVKAYAAFDAALDSGDVERYRFVDGMEGSQSVWMRKLESIKSIIDSLEAQVDSLSRRLRGMGITNMNLRRKSYYANLYRHCCGVSAT
jgi:hypothetical protein